MNCSLLQQVGYQGRRRTASTQYKNGFHSNLSLGKVPKCRLK